MLPAIHDLTISQKTIALVVTHFVLQPMGNGYGPRLIKWMEWAIDLKHALLL